MQAAVQSLRRMVGLSATWQTATGLTGQAAAAIERVGVATLPKEAPLPHAIVGPLPSFGFKRYAGGLGNYLEPWGLLQIYLAMATPPDLPQEMAEFQTMAFAEGILFDLAALAGADDPGQTVCHLSITDMELLGWQESAVEHRRSLGHFWHGNVLVRWGT